MTKIEFPNLKITLPDADAQPFYDRLDDFVVKGNNDDAKERPGRLVYLDSSGQPLLTSKAWP